MFYLALTVAAAAAAAAFCSALETILLDTTSAEIEALGRESERRANMLALAVCDTGKTLSALRAAGAVSAVFGGAAAGLQSAALFGGGVHSAFLFPVLLTLLILLPAGIFPRILRTRCGPALRSILVFPLHCVRTAVSVPAKLSLRPGDKTPLRNGKRGNGDDKILLLAERGRKSGAISSQERDLIANTLSLDDIAVEKIMTPRTVVMALEADTTVRETFEKHPSLDFSRIPVCRGGIDNIVGIVRRRDILTAMAGDKYDSKVVDFAKPAVFVPENSSALAVMKQLVKNHQQMGIVVDEFASPTGVVTLEDIFEHLLGSEIFEADDVAVDMRELARNRENGGERNAPH